MDATRQVRRLMRRAGTTYAAEAGVRLADEPMPLFQVLTLAMLAAKPIGSQIAVAAARELFAAGVRTPRTALATPRAELIAAFGRAGYARYDESSATRIVAMSEKLRDDYGGDLRRLAAVCDDDVGEAHRRLEEFTGIGHTGAAIFLREVQDTWTWVRPYFDDRALTAARGLGLPDTPDALGALAPRSSAKLAAALVRVSLDDELYAEVA
ncbi:endonuclease [Mycobacterium sp. ACS4331]|uniref:endonuclease n=1 Tax=Mycobacterium sp. ACS4331 TaxID=1834121 RepID=UPI0008010584|nr:endonuclease [Mycobacterium sp. ACS4331]OBF11390.1 endonuclease [Mycobacterium sp. ACS4331]